MKSPRFLFAALVLASAPALAAPAEAPANTPATAPVAGGLAPIVVPQLDADAIALMDEAVKAYAALGALSQKFVVTTSMDGKAMADSSGEGSFAFQKPGSARMESLIGDEVQIFVTDGATLTYQVESDKYQVQPIKRNFIQSVLSSMPSAADTPLGMLVSGRNPISDVKAPKWQSARLDSKDGLPGVVLLGPARGTRKAATFGFYLDPQTRLLSRVEVAAQVPNEPGQPDIQVSEITTLMGNVQTLEPAIFRYVPGPGIERFYAYDKRLVEGAKPFPLVGKTLDGKALSLDQYKGRVVLLDFWATWCGPCRAEMPNIIADYKKYHAQGFDVVSVSLDPRESENRLRKYVADNGMNWPQLFDKAPFDGPNAKLYGVKAIPFALLIGKDGKIAAVNPRGEELGTEIQAALAK